MQPEHFRGKIRARSVTRPRKRGGDKGIVVENAQAGLERGNNARHQPFEGAQSYVPALTTPRPPPAARLVVRSEQVGWSCAGLLPLPAAAVAYPGACYPLKSQIRGAVKTCAPSFQRQGLARGPKGLHTRPLRPLHSPCGSAARWGGSRVSARRGARAVSRGIVDSPQ